MKKIYLCGLAFLFQGVLSLAFALGINGIAVKSGLDQRLHVELELTNVPANQKLFFAVKAESSDQPIQDIGYVLLKNKKDMDILKITSQKPISQAVVKLSIIGKDNGKQVLAETYTIMLDPIPQPAEASFEHYGPAGEKDTVSSIAAAVKPVYVGLDDAKHAIRVANPHAFEKNNPDKIIKGSFLIIPDLSFHINRNQVNNESKISELNTQFKTLSKQLSTELDGVHNKNGQLSQQFTVIENKMGVLLESIAKIERGQKAIRTRLASQPAVVQGKASSSDGYSFTVNVAALIILMLAVLWLAYRLLKRYKDNKTEDKPVLVKEAPLETAAVEEFAESEQKESDAEEDSEVPLSTSSEGYNARTVTDEDLFISDKMKSKDGLFLNTSLDEESEEEQVEIKVEAVIKEDIAVEETPEDEIHVHTLIIDEDEADTPAEDFLETPVVDDESVPKVKSEEKEPEDKKEKESKLDSKLKLKPLDEEEK